MAGRYVEDAIDEVEWLRRFFHLRMGRICSTQQIGMFLQRDHQLARELVLLYAKKHMRTPTGENVYTRRGQA
jgi:hypothetical protein